MTEVVIQLVAGMPQRDLSISQAARTSGAAPTKALIVKWPAG
jgi:hypothetical protein